MSQYNKTVLTRAGLELAKRANAGQARFEITRAVTSADDWSNKTIQDIEAVTAIPNIMQQGTIMDTEEVESNNSVMGVSLCFTNKNLSAGYQIKIIGVYVKEEGQENDFLYAVTTAVTPEHMPDFSDEVLYRFNMQLYLVIGKAQAVNVVINDGASVTHKQFDNYKSEVTASLEKIENAHKEDMSHVVKSASINGGDEFLPDEAGKLELVVPDPDLSKYVSLEQLAETLKTKADITAIPDKTATEEGIRQAKQMAQEADTKAQSALDTKADKTTVEENLATKANQSDLDKTNAEVAKKANSEDVSTDISNLQNQINSKTTGTIITDYDIASKTPTKKTDRYNNKWLVDQNVLGQFADAINGINGTWNRYTHDDGFDLLTLWGKFGIHYCHNSNMTNVPDWFTDKRGTAFVFTFDNNSQTMIYASCTGYGLAYYNKLEGKWHKLATDNDITDLQNSVNSKVNVDGPLFKNLTQFNNWSDLFDGYSVNGWTATNGSRLVAFRDDTNGGNTIGSNGAGIGFGGGDTKGVLNVAYSNHTARIIGGNGSAPVWHEDIAWKTDVNDLQNQIQQLKDNQFEVQTFTDATAAASWEAQRPGKRMAIVNK